ncbi:MAG: hypothetical protein QXZ68_04930, partial [Candidatus Bathyarchaeia archaeon]
CANFRAELGNWCISYMHSVKKVYVDLPCKYFEPKTEVSVKVKPTKRKNKGFFVASESFPVGYFSPIWISQYIAKSIALTGDMSMAYDLLLEDASPQLLKRLKPTRKG